MEISFFLCLPAQAVEQWMDFFGNLRCHDAHVILQQCEISILLTVSYTIVQLWNWTTSKYLFWILVLKALTLDTMIMFIYNCFVISILISVQRTFVIGGNMSIFLDYQPIICVSCTFHYSHSTCSFWHPQSLAVGLFVQQYAEADNKEITWKIHITSPVWHKFTRWQVIPSIKSQ